MPSRRTPRRVADFTFDTVVADRGPTGLWPHLLLPPDASQWLGKRGLVNVIVNVNGLSFQRTARPDGEGGHFILFDSEMRERSGVEPSDRVHVALAVDLAPRTVDPPGELELALRGHTAAREAFSAMPPSDRRAYVDFIEAARRPEMRERRVQQALRMMAQWGVERAARPPRKR